MGFVKNWRVEIQFTDTDTEDSYSQDELVFEIQRVIERELYLKITKFSLSEVIEIVDGVYNA